MSNETLAMDLEGDNFLDKITTIWCMAIADVTNPHQVQTYTDHDSAYPPLAEGMERLRAAKQIAAHNFIGYDWPVIEKYYPGTVRFEQIYDTMVTGGLLEPTRKRINLDGYGAQLGYPKGNFSDFSQYSDEMRTYMERDCEICALLYNKQVETMISWKARGVDWRPALRMEHNIQVPLSLQMQNGFPLNEDLAWELEGEFRSELAELTDQLQVIYPPQYRPAETAEWSFSQRTWLEPRVFTPKGNNKAHGYTKDAPITKVEQRVFNPGSRDQIAYRLSHKYGWVPSQFTDGGSAKVDDDALSEVEHPEAEIMKRYLSVDKMLGQVADGQQSWLNNVENGRVHGYVRSNGCRTYRMSHSRPNMAQVSKKDVRMRQCWIPEEGQVLVGCDADAIELRLLACYLYPWDQGAYAEAVLNGRKEEGTDAHSLNQKAIGLFSRDNAKTFFYAMIYGSGDPNLGSIVVADAQEAGQPRPKGSLAAIGKKARTALETGITGLGQLIRAVQSRAKERKYLILPDGRPVMTGQRVALNSLLQGAGAVVMKKALELFHTDYYESSLWLQACDELHYLANVHDEVQMSSPPEWANEVGAAFCTALERAGEALDLPVPFTGEAKIGNNWAETH